MPVLPRLPRERVAVGTASATAGLLLGYTANGPIQAFGAGGLVGVGVTMVVASLFRLRREARASRR